MTQPKIKIKKGDQVIVLTGSKSIKGSVGTVKKVLPTEGRVVVEGVNVIRRHLKPSAQNPDGVMTKEASIHISNVAFYDSNVGKAAKLGYKLTDEGKKVRYSKRTGEIIS